MRRQIAVFYNVPKRKKVIIDNAKQEGNIIYGARAIQAHLGILSRQTEDYDIFSKNPKKTARKVEKALDNGLGFNYYYTQPGMHTGTYKVKSIGYDMKKGTRDDEGIADYTILPRPKPRFKVINGVRYRILNEEIKAKRRSLADKQYAFRHEKDRRDLGIIKTNLSSRNPKIARVRGFSAKP